MQLPAPTSLREIVTDGAIAQYEAMSLFHARFGTVSKGSVNSAEPHQEDSEVDGKVSVSFQSSADKQSHSIAGRWIASIHAGKWRWHTHAVDNFAHIPQLHGLQPASDELLSAARTLFRNVPALLVPVDGDTVAVVVLTELDDFGPLGLALTHGLAHLPHESDPKRALLAYATLRGLPLTEDSDETAPAESTVSLGSDAHVRFLRDYPYDVNMSASPSPSIRQLRRDAHTPGVRAEENFENLSAQQRQELPTYLLATVSNGVWTWSWADPELKNAPSAYASSGLRRFGIDHGVLDMVRPQVDYALAQEFELAQACGAVSGFHVVRMEALNETTTGVRVFRC